MSAKLCKLFPHFCKIFLEQFVWTLDVEKFRTIMPNIANTYTIAKKRNLFLSSNIIRYD